MPEYFRRMPPSTQPTAARQEAPITKYLHPHPANEFPPLRPITRNWRARPTWHGPGAGTRQWEPTAAAIGQ